MGGLYVRLFIACGGGTELASPAGWGEQLLESLVQLSDFAGGDDAAVGGGAEEAAEEGGEEGTEEGRGLEAHAAVAREAATGTTAASTRQVHVREAMRRVREERLAAVARVAGWTGAGETDAAEALAADVTAEEEDAPTPLSPLTTVSEAGGDSVESAPPRPSPRPPPPLPPPLPPPRPPPLPPPLHAKAQGAGGEEEATPLRGEEEGREEEGPLAQLSAALAEDAEAELAEALATHEAAQWEEEAEAIARREAEAEEEAARAAAAAEGKVATEAATLAAAGGSLRGGEEEGHRALLLEAYALLLGRHGGRHPSLTLLPPPPLAALLACVRLGALSALCPTRPPAEGSLPAAAEQTAVCAARMLCALLEASSPAEVARIESWSSAVAEGACSGAAAEPPAADGEPRALPPDWPACEWSDGGNPPLPPQHQNPPLEACASMGAAAAVLEVLLPLLRSGGRWRCVATTASVGGGVGCGEGGDVLVSCLLRSLCLLLGSQRGRRDLAASAPDTLAVLLSLMPAAGLPLPQPRAACRLLECLCLAASDEALALAAADAGAPLLLLELCLAEGAGEGGEASGGRVGCKRRLALLAACCLRLLSDARGGAIIVEDGDGDGEGRPALRSLCARFLTPGLATRLASPAAFLATLHATESSATVFWSDSMRDTLHAEVASQRVALGALPSRRPWAWREAGPDFAQLRGEPAVFGVFLRAYGAQAGGAPPSGTPLPPLPDGGRLLAAMVAAASPELSLLPPLPLAAPGGVYSGVQPDETLSSALGVRAGALATLLERDPAAASPADGPADTTRVAALLLKLVRTAAPPLALPALRGLRALARASPGPWACDAVCAAQLLLHSTARDEVAVHAVLALRGLCSSCAAAAARLVRGGVLLSLLALFGAASAPLEAREAAASSLGALLRGGGGGGGAAAEEAASVLEHLSCRPLVARFFAAGGADGADADAASGGGGGGSGGGGAAAAVAFYDATHASARLAWGPAERDAMVAALAVELSPLVSWIASSDQPAAFEWSSAGLDERHPPVADAGGGLRVGGVYVAHFNAASGAGVGPTEAADLLKAFVAALSAEAAFLGRLQAEGAHRSAEAQGAAANLKQMWTSVALVLEAHPPLHAAAEAAQARRLAAGALLLLRTLEPLRVLDTLCRSAMSRTRP